MQNYFNISRRVSVGVALGLLACTSVACGSDDDEKSGDVIVTAYGEAYIEDGISAENVDDSWTIEFESFIVTFEDIKVGNQTYDGPKPVELARKSDGEGFVVETLRDVDGGEHNKPEFTTSGVVVKGSATKDDVTKTFNWVFNDKVKYTECEATVKVDGDNSDSFELTIHADHIFADSLVSETPDVLFGPLAAADANDDGEITEAELKEAGIGEYDPGNEAIDNLWDFLRAQTHQLGHVNGEGHCKSEKQ